MLWKTISNDVYPLVWRARHEQGTKILMSMWTWSVMGQQRFTLTPVFSEWVLQPIREWGHLSVDASQRSPGPQRLLYALLLLAPRHRRFLPVTRGEDTPTLNTPESSHLERAEQFGGFIVVFSMFKPANKKKAWLFWVLSVSRNSLRVSGWKLCSMLFPW